MQRYKFILDSGSAYLPATPKDVTVLPMCINVEQNHELKTYISNQDITRKELKHFLDEKAIVSTAQPVLGETITVIEKALTEYEKVIVLPISKELSGHYKSLLLLQKDWGDRVIVLDSLTIGIEGDWIVEELKALIDKNEIELAQEALNNWIYKHQQYVCGAVIVGDTKQLIQGGRLKGIKGLIAKTLKLKLIIKYDGKLDYVAKDLTFDGAVLKTLDIIDKQIKFRKNGIKKITVMNDLDNQEHGHKLTELVKSQLLRENVHIEQSLLPDCVVSHTGFDTFSILIQAKEPQKNK